jgi:hypothetical protein
MSLRSPSSERAGRERSAVVASEALFLLENDSGFGTLRAGVFYLSKDQPGKGYHDHSQPEESLIEILGYSAAK